jgi:hypothetical protein
MTDFAGLGPLLQSHRPHLAFVQEVSPHASLLSLAAATGYSAFLSTSTAPPQTDHCGPCSCSCAGDRPHSWLHPDGAVG